MRKINLGCGGNIIPGWENYDMDVDMTRPLPFENESIDFIFVEHALEHISMHNGVKFLTECYRVLKKDGIIKIIVPDITVLHRNTNHPYINEYLRFCKERGWCDGTVGGNIHGLTFLHGHESLWTQDLLKAILFSIGYSKADNDHVHRSSHAELDEIAGHWKVYNFLSPGIDGRTINEMDSSCVEGIK